MSSLHDLQSSFTAALLDAQDAGGLAGEIVTAGIAAADRISLYRNNWLGNAVQALALEFPVIERLVGKEFFGQFVREFLVLHPSRSGDLHPLGAPFPAFVSQRFSATPLEYLGDVAALEWAWQQSLVARDAEPLDGATIAAVPAGRVPALRFRAHPGTRLVRSPWPVFTIWQHNRSTDDGRGDDHALIHLEHGAEHVLIHRSLENTVARCCEPADFRFLDALCAGCCLAEAYDRASAAATSFDVGRSLRQAMKDGIFCALERDGPG